MRFGTDKAGAVLFIDADGGVVPLDGAAAPSVADMAALIDGFDALGPQLRALAGAPDAARPRASAVDWAAPIPRPKRNIFCVGKNYRAHAAEFAASGYDAAAPADEDAPDAPVVFTKAPETVIGPDAAIVIPRRLTAEADYEAELALVIGRAGRFIPRATAMEHVFGYTLLNDVTAHDLQRRHRQWFLGKSIETFCPMGPVITHRDAVDFAALDLECRVNGALRQRAVARDLIFDAPALIETLSRSLTLQPGDVIATGTPAGVGIGASPPVFLKDGDVVALRSDGIGALSNPVRMVD